MVIVCPVRLTTTCFTEGSQRSGGVGEPVHVGPGGHGHVRHGEAGGGACAGTRQHDKGPPQERQGEKHPTRPEGILKLVLTCVN